MIHHQILYRHILPVLTDMGKNQFAFWDMFLESEELGCPIKKILEFGVCRVRDEEKKFGYGQSTKILLTLGDLYKVDKMYSCDIDDKSDETIDACFEWLLMHNLVPQIPHEFLCMDSLLWDHDTNLDLIFLDTSHDDTYVTNVLGIKGATDGPGATTQEINHFIKYLSPNGRLVFHDTKVTYGKAEYGKFVGGAVDKFIHENPEYHYDELPSNNFGLGQIIRKDSLIYRSRNEN